MPRYYFHLRTGAGLELPDEEGDELLDLEAAEEHAVASIKELVRGAALDWSKCSYEIYEGSRYVMTVWFTEAAARVPSVKRRQSSGDHHL